MKNNTCADSTVDIKKTHSEVRSMIDTDILNHDTATDAESKSALTRKIDHWKKELLDTSKRNKMIHYRETSRATVRILEPDAEELFNRLAFSDKPLTFQRPIDKDSDFRTFAMLSLLETLSYSLPVHVGDIKTGGTLLEREKTLKNLRSKAKLAQEEQGTHILYLSFGFLLWREKNRENASWLKSPLLLMPVTLEKASLNAPYTLRRYDDEIEVNPTLSYLFQTEYGIDLPAFSLKNKSSFRDYMDTIEKIADERGWGLAREVSLGLLSFLKISMYHDLNNNRERILNHPVLLAISGDNTALQKLPEEASFDLSDPRQWHEVLDSDSSQKEAILLSKQGISFVMVGPPGTGKSQTITNIIVEALADGKKVLFVSEKAAALQVVLKRLTEAGLSEFCLSLHNYKANKKEIIESIGANLSLPQEYPKDSILHELTELFYDQKHLDQYVEELHKDIEPLGESIYVVYGKLSKLNEASVVEFTLEKPTEVTREQHAALHYCVSAFEKALHNLDGPLSANPWRDAAVPASGQAFKTEFLNKTEPISETLDTLADSVQSFNETYHTHLDTSWSGVGSGIAEIKEALELPAFPDLPHDPDTLHDALAIAETEKRTRDEFTKALEENRRQFADRILDESMQDWLSNIEHAQERLARTGHIRTQAPLASVSETAAALDRIFPSLHTLAREYAQANRLAGLIGSDTFSNAAALHKSFSLLRSAPLPLQQYWFDGAVNARASEMVKKAAQHANAHASHRAKITANWQESIFSLDTAGLQQHFSPAYAPLCSDDAHCPIEERLESAVNHAEALRETVHTLMAPYEQATNLLCLPPQYTLQHIAVVSELLKLTSTISDLDAAWFDMHQNQTFRSLASDACFHQKQVQKRTGEILQDWDAESLTLDANAILSRFRTDYVGILYRLQPAYREDMRTLRGLYKHIGTSLNDAAAIRFLETLTVLNREKAWFHAQSESLTTTFGQRNRGLDTHWEKLAADILTASRIVELFPYGNIPAETVAALEAIVSDRHLSGIARQLAGELSAKKIAQLKSVLAALPYVGKVNDDTSLQEDILAKIQPFLENCAAQKTDLAQLRALSGKSSIDYADISSLLEDLAAMEQERRWFDDCRGPLSALLGSAYTGCESDWGNITDSIRCAASLAALFGPSGVPRCLLETACSNGAELPDCSALSEGSITALQADLAALFPEIDFETVSISRDLIPQLTAFRQTAQKIADLSRQIMPYVTDSSSLDTVAAALPKVAALKKKREELLSRKDALTRLFGCRYAGLDTDWDAILAELHAIEAFAQQEHPVLGAEFAKLSTGDPDCTARMLGALQQISDTYESLRSGVDYFSALFPDADLLTLPLPELKHRCLACRNDFGALNKWLDYTETKAECDKLGLVSFTDAIARLDYSVTDVTAAFERGFYTQWLTHAVSGVPAVQNFRRRVHEQHLEKFNHLDKKQFTLSRDRIRAKIISTFPDPHQIARPSSELGILRHEMEKQRRIMPLRKLFQKIPHLLLTLKPCLMMSPLSVAHFLEAGAYDFDMVIFDEASQIFPQDAIGAIFRAKQVIIAGDTKQLPPTNFFTASTSNATEEFDDDAYEDEPCDSILEETATVLPSRTLLWHYRSKHEHLIAFSNQSIYKNQLITFPSSSENEPDTGVEFVYVEDGYYESGGRNCNLPEARRCVELIREHIERHPERSLGVIAFSEKQQQVIAQEVQRFREQNPQYEAFFAEGKEDEFFVKNLENVQGDERDTIFFSVGYAKTKEQKQHHRPMAMRFGPLGVSGGERRLNVAITRAKINVKLVSSILSSDIDLSKTDSEGVKMLRSYLEFAKSGAATLASSHAPNRTDDFADTICAFIQSHGYGVRRYVGCSGYKIDIAIEDPNNTDHFVAGIECDGFSYASAKTARDRDRLRGSVLKNMGWNLYRVWSAEWHKDPDIEGEKLLAFLRQAIAECQNPSTQKEQNHGSSHHSQC